MKKTEKGKDLFEADREFQRLVRRNDIFKPADATSNGRFKGQVLYDVRGELWKKCFHSVTSVKRKSGQFSMNKKVSSALIPLYGTIRPSKAHQVALERLEKGGRLIFLHIVDYAPAKLLRRESGQMGEKGDIIRIYKKNLELTQRKAVKEFVNEIKPEAEEQGIELETIYISGDPAVEILEFVEKHDIDLVVMESLREKITSIFFGSVCDHVKKNARCEVLVVPRE